MDNNFNYKENEKKIYSKWQQTGKFKCEKKEGIKPFVVAMAPPNITAKLHIGHAFENTLADIFVRYNRLKGIPTLWVPGTDHASIATETKIVQKLKDEGKTKDMIGRENFLKEAFAWKEKYSNEIIEQFKLIGCSCDWDM